MLVTNLAILVLAGFIGFAVISKVPNTLHTPLMSGTNAIHGIVVLGGLLVIGFAANDLLNKVLLVIAIAFGTINVVGGFLVTDRMLGMFKRKPEPPQPAETDSSEQDRGSAATPPPPAAEAAPQAGPGSALEDAADAPPARPEPMPAADEAALSDDQQEPGDAA
jgi:NAD(P) transhydrogenase subunit alpha